MGRETFRKRMRGGIALVSALLLCLNLSAAGCSFGGIRIESIRDGSIQTPTEPGNSIDPVNPGNPAEHSEPEPEPEPEIGVSYAESDFRETRGDGWVVKPLSFAPSSVRCLGGSRVFALGFPRDPDGNPRQDVFAAAVDLEAMTVLEREIPLGPLGEDEYRIAEAFAVDGIPCVIDIEKGLFVRLDPETLEETARVSLEPEFRSTAIALPNGDKRAVFASGSGGKLLMLDLSEADSIRTSEIRYTVPEGFETCYLVGAASNGALIASFTAQWDAVEWRQSFGMIDPESGETSLFVTSDTVSLLAVGDCVLEDDYRTGVMTLHRPGAEIGEIRLTPPEDSYLVWPEWNGGGNSLFFMRTGDGSATLTEVDLTSLRTSAAYRAELETEWDFVGSVGETERQVVALLYEGENYDGRLIYWEKSGGAASTLDSGGPDALYPTLTRSEQAEIRREIDRIYEETGVSVYVGNDAVRYLSGYAVQPVTDPAKQLQGIRSLAEFFDHCPPGFIRELTEWNSSIDICLTGKIIPEPGNRDSISDASAFVNQTGGLQVMVVDVTQGGLTQTVAHEFLHIAENSMANMHEAWWNGEREDPTDVFILWTALNPEDFSYSYVYTNEDGTTVGSDDPRVWSVIEWEEERDVNSVWFMDGYSTTYPTEDRARIFENLAAFRTEELPGAFASDHIRQKAAYLCACLRRAFASVAAADEVFWEQSLDPAYTYEFFEQNYIVRAEG
ncbi:MAG: hypothetical protein E7576_03210 [Ruminococcaceae bacterium]|nr:hypothetical protein [Oscillospiraceae bacterium]